VAASIALAVLLAVAFFLAAKYEKRWITIVSWIVFVGCAEALSVLGMRDSHHWWKITGWTTGIVVTTTTVWTIGFLSGQRWRGGTNRPALSGNSPPTPSQPAIPTIDNQSGFAATVNAYDGAQVTFIQNIMQIRQQEVIENIRQDGSDASQ
jgi:hypothetical protein